MLIATIILIANLISLIWKEKTFITWGWVAGIYGIEIGIYVLIFLIFVLIVWMLDK